jgi:hypothetical protein
VRVSVDGATGETCVTLERPTAGMRAMDAAGVGIPDVRGTRFEKII